MLNLAFVIVFLMVNSGCSLSRCLIGNFMQKYFPYGAPFFYNECVYSFAIDENVQSKSLSFKMSLYRVSQWISKTMLDFRTYEDL